MRRQGRITLAVDGAVARLVIDNPEKRNALDLAMIAELSAGIRRVSSDRRVRVLVLSGAGGKAFSAGADLDVLTEGRDFSRRLRRIEQALERAARGLARLPIPTIAALSGYCMGGGVQIALACDLRLAADDLAIGIPAVRMGLVYPRTALAKLVRLVGASRAKFVLMSAQAFAAEAAAAMGLVDAVFPARRFKSTIDDLADAIAGHPPGAVRAYKQVIDALADDNAAAAERIARKVNRGDEMYAALERVRASRKRRID
jgi:enoyl-CoA hydratase/carnithine racemase